MPLRTHDEHEALCRRCGVSCHFAVPVNGVPVVIDELHCKFLEREPAGTFRCSVYERRYEVAPWCHSAEEALAGGFLAQDCPYARGVPGYRGKVRVGRALLPPVLAAIRDEVARLGVPIGASPESALRLLEQGGGTWRYEESTDGTRYHFFRTDPGEDA